jgi:hypothetical protein
MTSMGRSGAARSAHNSLTAFWRRFERLVNASLGVVSKFLLADLAFTFLPLGVIALLQAMFGQLGPAILLDPAWAFAAIIVFGLAMTRLLELKVRYQKDRSERLFILMRVCILGLVAAVICLALSQMKAAGLQVSTSLFLAYQWTVLLAGVSLLCLAHVAREVYVSEWLSLPPRVGLVGYLRFIKGDLENIRDDVDELGARISRRNEFESDGLQDEAEDQSWVSRQYREIDHLLLDLDSCVDQLTVARRAWPDGQTNSETRSSRDGDAGGRGAQQWRQPDGQTVD